MRFKDVCLELLSFTAFLTISGIRFVDPIEPVISNNHKMMIFLNSNHTCNLLTRWLGGGEVLGVVQWRVQLRGGCVFIGCIAILNCFLVSYILVQMCILCAENFKCFGRNIFKKHTV